MSVARQSSARSASFRDGTLPVHGVGITHDGSVQLRRADTGGPPSAESLPAQLVTAASSADQRAPLHQLGPEQRPRAGVRDIARGRLASDRPGEQFSERWLAGQRVGEQATGVLTGGDGFNDQVAPDG